MLESPKSGYIRISFESFEEQPGVDDDARVKADEATQRFLETLSPEQMSLLILAGGGDSHKEAAALGINAKSKFPVDDGRGIFDFEAWQRRKDTEADW